MMFRRILSSALLVMAMLATARAGISEIKAEFLNRTAALSPTAILTAPGSDANYLLCLYLEEPGSAAAMTGTLSWTDENGNSQSFTPTNVQNIDGLPNWSASGCTLARVLANTNLNLAVSGTPTPKYSVSAGGFGLWPGQPQQQGGIGEIYNSEPYGCYETGLSPGLYLVAVNNPLASGGYVSWIDDFSGTDTNEASIGSGLVMMFRVASASSYNFFVCPQPGGNVSLISLGTPATGSGPLTDYEWNAPSETTTVQGTVVPAGTGGNFIVAATVAETPNSGGVSLDMTFTSAGGVVPSISVSDSGAPAEFIVPAALPTSGTTLLGGNTLVEPCFCTGSTPTYSLESAAIQF